MALLAMVGDHRLCLCVLPYSPRCSSQVGVSAFTVMGYVFGCVVCETLTSRLS